MVTGAGGSIGSELCLQIAARGPALLICLDNSEHNLYKIGMQLEARFPSVKRVLLIQDVFWDECGLRDVFVSTRPDIVFHAAALKHVPLMENDFNLFAGVQVNVMGTRLVAVMCKSYKARMILISTDKAVYPSSLMGLTKRIAELTTAYQANESKIWNLGWAVVRFGNVLNSSGSVVPRFMRQIQEGGPVTVTHPDMTRYMMTIEAAVGLTLDAAFLSRKDPSVSVYVLDMGMPVRIVDLARDLIQREGLEPDKDIAIEFTGVRPGEKLFEQLHYTYEDMQWTVREGIRRALLGHAQIENFDYRYSNVQNATIDRNPVELRKALLAFVPEFQGQEVLV